MHTFLLDLLHDLRAKRLLPIAALLLVAIAAVPFALVKKEQPGSVAATPPTKAQTASDKLPTIALDEVSTKAPSNLTQFSQRNPFKPLRDIPKTSADEGENKTVDLSKAPSRDEPASSPKAVSKASSGGSGASSGGSSGGTGSGAGGYVGPRTVYYDYRADIEFGLAGKAKSMKQVAAFTLLGDKEEPAAMFMGVTDDHDYAVFTVDTARYDAQGKHECKPTPERCDFVYLKADGDANETTFTSLDGSKSYELKLTAIKRVILDRSDVEDVPTEDKSKGAAAGKRDTVDPEPRSLFDILAKRR